MKIFLILFLALTAACSSGKKNFDEEAWREAVEATDSRKLYAYNYREGRFFNPWMEMESSGFINFLRWRFSKKEKYSSEEEAYLPEVIDGAFERIRESGDRDFILWIGHNTFLVRIDNIYWITDPIFSKRALLPARKTGAALTADDLKGLTDSVKVVISHNHYDHLDRWSIRNMPSRSVFYVPMGLKRLVKGWTNGEVVEMNWWDEAETAEGFKLVCLPAQHWSRRISQGINKSLWASFMLVKGDLKIYFGMDSGYFKGYREFGSRFKGIDYAIMPVTAYHPRWFMHYAHINVEEALKAFDELGAALFIPAQWGAFNLGDNPTGYPGLDLKREIEKQGLDKKRFKILQIGEILYI